jgi:hypothetical protein
MKQVLLALQMDEEGSVQLLEAGQVEKQILTSDLGRTQVCSHHFSLLRPILHQ